MGEPAFNAHLVAIARCQEALADFANYERWRILDYLNGEYGRNKYQLIAKDDPHETTEG